MFLINVYVPEQALESVKKAMFNAGAGKYNHYANCCWQTLGQGQFLPLDKSHPAIGQPNQLEIVNEYKVEMICHSKDLNHIIHALKTAHPYEEPAFHYYPINTAG